LSTPVVRWLAIALGSVVAGEALALLVGVDWSSAWSWKNNLLAPIELATCGLLIYLVLVGSRLHESVLPYTTLSIVLVSHAYRAWEYLAGQPDKYCLSHPSFILNNLKLAGAVAALDLSILHRMQA
jgi:hypothetical protein